MAPTNQQLAAKSGGEHREPERPPAAGTTDSVSFFTSAAQYTQEPSHPVRAVPDFPGCFAQRRRDFRAPERAVESAGGAIDRGLDHERIRRWEVPMQPAVKKQRVQQGKVLPRMRIILRKPFEVRLGFPEPAQGLRNLHVEDAGFRGDNRLFLDQTPG